MSTIRKFTAIFQCAFRLDNTRDGNPVWEVYTSSGVYRTEDNAHVGHEMVDYADADGPMSLAGKRATFHRTPLGRITRIVPER